MQKKKLTSTLAFCLLLATSASAQWECPSRIGGNLKPFPYLPENLTWATEVTTSAGYAGDNGISNAMAFLALDYSTEKFTLYAEGGVKSWIRFNGNGYDNEKYALGMREAYLRYAPKKQVFTLGLQSTQSPDHFLMNERMLGLKYQLSFGNWTMDALTGSVQEQFARNGSFCTLGYLYNIVPGRPRTPLGQSFGETSPMLLSLSYSPRHSSKNVLADEFGSTGELEGSPKNNKSLFSLTKVGALAYHEYGSLIETKALFTGLYAEMEVAGITVKPEALLQTSRDGKTLLYYLHLQKNIEWSGNQQTRIFGRYIGYGNLSGNVHPLQSFSNIFAGEVLRLDAYEMPILQVGLKHSLPSVKTSLKIQAAVQMGSPHGYTLDPYNPSEPGQRMREIDVSVGHNFGSHILLNAHIGYLEYPKMTDPYVYENRHSPWGKLEIRFTY